MLLQLYVEQVMMMCRVQKWELLLWYFMSYLPFNIFMHYIGSGYVTWIPLGI